ncbi:hypothetical protein Bamb_3282 [Burkholderia ambifaria AMMD]|uniref:Uncharacterized protein n=1 Tax=Burkholderia ambifaria (strain ATCC BAA-244 / DSM 16087 / CCUG 44356 / LMG 19182 / AMMD) TaxID=339670 RepID=Q0BAI6_BURCM|nr:hypothetical protein Bamb_3282 [Burkholderia ambifaria AMMD]
MCCQLIHYPDGSIVEAPVTMWSMGVFFCAPVSRADRRPDRAAFCIMCWRAGRPCGARSAAAPEHAPPT